MPLIGRNIYEQQAHNRHLTLIVMSMFVLFLCFIGAGFDVYWGGIRDSSFVPLGTLVAFGLGTASSLWSLYGGASAVLSSVGAVSLDSTIAEHRQLLNVVEEMSIAAGLPRPEVRIIPDDDPNALATGVSPDKSYIAVTQGLLKALNREELQAVVAHEIGHIRNYDIRLMTVVAALAGTILLLSDWSSRMLRFGGSRGRSERRSSKGLGQLGVVFLILWIIGIILAPILSRLLATAVSRQREYLADASAAELTRNPLALANALRKIELAAAPTASVKRGAAHLCIVDPLGRKLNSKEGWFAEIFGTHPPLEKRIIALQAMAYRYATPVA
jgi:heat shock protein HtpX